jgi:hypothetical protein
MKNRIVVSYILPVSLIVWSIMLGNSAPSYGQELRVKHNFSKGQLVSSVTGKIKGGELTLSHTAGDFYVVGVWAGESAENGKSPLQIDGVVECLVKNGEQIQKGDILTSDGFGNVMVLKDKSFPVGIAIEDFNGKSLFIKVRLLL